MRMGRYHWVYALLAVFLLSQPVFAEDFYWAAGTNNAAIYKAATPIASCKLYSAAQNRTYYQADDKFTYTSNNQGTCSFTWYNGAVKQQDSTTISRRGAGCTNGTYNPVTYQCDYPNPDAGQVCDPTKDPNTGFPKITSTAGECVAWASADKSATCKYLANTAGTGTFPAFIKFDSDGEPQAPEMQSLGCEVEVVIAASCKLPAAKSTGGISLVPAGKSCIIAGVYTGQVAEGSGGGYVPAGDPDGDVEGICAPGEPCEVPDEPTIEEKTPCKYVFGEFGIQSCTSSEFKGDPGEMNCGTVNGGPYKCTTKVPTSNGIQIGTTVKTTDNGDGTTTVTKTDKIDQVKCQGAGSCVTNTTTSVSTTIKNGNGETISQSGQCTGSACSDSTGKGDGDGDGLKDCALGKECDEEDNEVGKQDFFTPGEDTIESVFGEFNDKLKASPIVTAGSGFLTLPTGGTCPQWHASIWEFQIDLDQICTTDIPWGAIRAIILALASFVAFRWALL